VHNSRCTFSSARDCFTTDTRPTMPAKKVSKPAQSPNGELKQSKKSATHPLFDKKSKNLGIGGTVRVKKDLGRYVKWPKYIRIQRQRKVLSVRLKIPPALNLFRKAADKSLSSSVLKLCMKYRPEDKSSKKARMMSRGAAEINSMKNNEDKPLCVQSGINHVAQLIEEGKGKLVIIAHDVAPIELVLWLPQLCQKMNVPFVIVKGKSSLGHIVNKKTATALVITDVRGEDKHELTKISEACRTAFNMKMGEYKKQQGGQVMGLKAVHKRDKRAALIAREEAKRNQVI